MIYNIYLFIFIIQIYYLLNYNNYIIICLIYLLNLFLILKLYLNNIVLLKIINNKIILTKDSYNIRLLNIIFIYTLISFLCLKKYFSTEFYE